MIFISGLPKSSIRRRLFGLLVALSLPRWSSEALTAPALRGRLDRSPASAQFVVLFAFDSVQLTRTAREVLSAAAKACAFGSAKVTGYADAPGSDEYNLWLSQRRAQAVAFELVKLGVASMTISVDWKGEFDPLVPNARPGPVPENRRVVVEVVEQL